MPSILTRKQNRAGAQAAGMRLTKRHGQHLLRDQGIINRIVAHGDLRPSDTVLEIGPGMGALTFAMVPKVRRVLACEIDPMMIVELQKRVNNDELARERLTIFNGDFLAMNVPRFDACVANCPYNVSSAIVLKLLTLHQTQPWRRAVLMFQLEFAQRMAAQPGTQHWSRLSATTQLLSRCQLVIRVGRNSFNPPPKVESAVVLLEPRSPAPEVSLAEYDGLCKIIFNRKNRTVASLFREASTLRRLERAWRTANGLPMPVVSANDAGEDEDAYQAPQAAQAPVGAAATAALLLGGAALEAPAPRKKTKRAVRAGALPTDEFRTLVNEVLVASGCATQDASADAAGEDDTPAVPAVAAARRGLPRAQQMSSVDILDLLNAFLARGVHFVGVSTAND